MNVSRSSPSLTMRISCFIASFPSGVAATIGSPVRRVAGVARRRRRRRRGIPRGAAELDDVVGEHRVVVGRLAAGVTGTTKRTVVPLAPAPVQVRSAVFGSKPIVPSAHTTPSISGSWSVPSVAASGVVNATVTGAPLPAAIGCGASLQSPPAVVQSANAQSSVAGALGPATIHDDRRGLARRHLGAPGIRRDLDARAEHARPFQLRRDRQVVAAAGDQHRHDGAEHRERW